jgi:tetratricopeptide (TPR) repeat protein
MAEPSTLTDKFNQAYRQGHYSEAADLCAALADEFEEKGDLLSASEMKNNRSVALLKAGKAQAALEAAEGTDAVFASEGDLRRQAIALGNQAAALEALGKLDKAASLYRNSADLLEKIGDRELYSIVMKSLSSIYMKQGKQMDTVIALQAALEVDNNLSPREKFIKKFLKRLLSFLP